MQSEVGRRGCRRPHGRASRRRLAAEVDKESRARRPPARRMRPTEATGLPAAFPHSGRADDHGGPQGRPDERRRRLLDRGPRRGLQGVQGPGRAGRLRGPLHREGRARRGDLLQGLGPHRPDRAARRLLGERHHAGAHHEPSRVARAARCREPVAADPPDGARGGQRLRAPGRREHARLPADGDRPLRTGRPRRPGRVRGAARHRRARAGHAGLRLELAVRARARRSGSPSPPRLSAGSYSAFIHPYVVRGSTVGWVAASVAIAFAIEALLRVLFIRPAYVFPDPIPFHKVGERRDRHGRRRDLPGAVAVRDRARGRARGAACRC